MTLDERINQLVLKHGGLRAVSRVLEIDSAYLHRLASGAKANPSERILRKLRLRKVTTYELRGKA